MSKTMHCRVCKTRFEAQSIKARYCSRSCANKWYNRRRRGMIEDRVECRTCATELTPREESIGQCFPCWVPPAAKHLSWSLLDKLYGGGIDRVRGQVGSTAGQANYTRLYAGPVGDCR